MAFFALSVGAIRRIMLLRIMVPASLPVAPALAVTAIRVISSSVLPAKRIVLPMRSIACPISSMFVALLLAAKAHRSMKCPTSSNPMPAAPVALTI